MLKRLNKLEKQYGGSIPFSAMEDSKDKKTPRRTRRIKRIRKKSSEKSVSPSKVRRKGEKKVTKRPKGKKKRNLKGKKCSCGSHKYQGDENTPRGMGKCEECLPLNIVLKGKDGKLYENRKEGWFKIN